MKNTYSKPVLVIESFVMSQSIAHNCGDQLDFNQATLKYKGSCGWEIAPGTVVFKETPTCTFTGEFEGICYNNPSDGINIFNS